MLKTTLICLLLVFGTLLYAQEFQKIPYVKVGTELVPIKKVTAKVSTKLKGLGFGGGTSSFEIPGQSSEFPIAATSTFLISLPDGVDPTLWYPLYKTEIKDGNRFTVMVKVNVLKSDNIDYGKSRIEYNVKKLKDGGFELVPDKMEPGEYAFVTSTRNPKEYDAFAFTIK